jgi:PAS domain S-box-containing protein
VKKAYSSKSMPTEAKAGIEPANSLACDSQTLQDSVKRFELLQLATQDAVYDWDFLTNKLFWNRNTSTLFRYPMDQIRTDLDWWSEKVHPEERDTLVQSLHHAIESGQNVWAVEYRFLRGDGTYCDVLDRGYIAHNDAGTPIRMIGAMTDITERKQAEKAIQERENRFKNLSDASPDMIWLADSDGTVSYINRTLREFLGQSPEAVRNIDWQRLVHPDDLAEVVEKRVPALATNTSYSHESRILRWDGEYRWLWVFVSPCFAPEKNEFLGRMGTAIDITERKEAEQALKESEQLFRMISNTIPIMIWMLDPKGEITFVNETCMNFTGLSFEESIGDTMSHFFHPDDIDPLRIIIQQAYQDKKPFLTEQRKVFHRNEYRWTIVQGVPYYDNLSRFKGYIGTTIDINERKQYKEELERMVGEKTSALNAMNQELEAFSYSVSHDLRTPLRGIDGISQLIYKKYSDVLDEKGKEYLQILRHEAQRMSQLINDMLNLSRLSRGSMHWEEVKLSELANEVVEALRREDPTRKVTVDIQPKMKVFGDTNLLRSLLENLMGNAWKFTSKHQTAHIQFSSMQEDGQTVYCVKDDGAGFEMEYAENLFGAFQRLHDITEFEGTGIGLATVQRIVHRHGGKAWAVGEVEKGAQVFFTLVQDRS